MTVRRAATVMLVRDGASGVEVFALHRVRSMAFAGGMLAFPGGAVDPRDAGPLGWTGPDAPQWGSRLGVPPDEAHELVVAAVRELFEETGVLLADPDLLEPAQRESLRLAVTDHHAGLAEVLSAAGARLRSDLLRPWANWITPEGQARRYDTFFFLAAAPPGQEARSLTTEAESGFWTRPSAALSAADAGGPGLMPPTRAMLADLAAAVSVEHLLAIEKVVKPVMPQVVSAPGEPLRVIVPAEPEGQG